MPSPSEGRSSPLPSHMPPNWHPTAAGWWIGTRRRWPRPSPNSSRTTLPIRRPQAWRRVGASRSLGRGWRPPIWISCTMSGPEAWWPDSELARDEPIEVALLSLSDPYWYTSASRRSRRTRRTRPGDLLEVLPGIASRHVEAQDSRAFLVVDVPDYRWDSIALLGPPPDLVVIGVRFPLMWSPPVSTPTYS